MEDEGEEAGGDGEEAGDGEEEASTFICIACSSGAIIPQPRATDTPVSRLSPRVQSWHKCYFGNTAEMIAQWLVQIRNIYIYISTSNRMSWYICDLGPEIR